MEELKELRVSGGVLILDKHRVLSPVIPQSYKSMDDDILVRGEAYIDGAVYTRKLEVENGPLTICGALFAKNSINVQASNDKTISFKKAVACGGQVTMCDSGKKYFGADLNSGIIKLKNAVVAANVFGSEISLENCVVLGGVFATKTLQVVNSVFGTFNAPSALISGSNYMLYPSVFTVEPLHATEGAVLFNLTLADWGNLMKGLPESTMSGAVKINLIADEQRISLKDNDGNVTVWETYSVAGKVLAADLLDLKKLDNHFLLSVGALGEQLVKQYNFGCDRNGKPIKLTLETIGDFFQIIQTGVVKVKAIDGNVSFDDLKKFYTED